MVTEATWCIKGSICNQSAKEVECINYDFYLKPFICSFLVEHLRLLGPLESGKRRKLTNMNDLKYHAKAKTCHLVFYDFYYSKF